MIKMTRVIAALCLFLGSAILPAAAENTVLLPSIDITKEDIGKGQVIALHIEDLRADKTLGYTLKDDEREAIPSTQDITEIIYYQMIEALKAKGFVVDNGAGAGVPVLTLKINTLNYTLQKFFFTKELIIKTDLTAVVANGGGTLSKGYQLEKKMKDFVISGSNQEQKRMTQTISVALTELANDHLILNALAGKGSAPATPAAPPSPQRAPSTGGPVESRPLGPN
jgi:uncharacterized lipoprotein YajG